MDRRTRLVLACLTRRRNHRIDKLVTSTILAVGWRALPHNTASRDVSCRVGLLRVARVVVLIDVVKRRTV